MNYYTMKKRIFYPKEFKKYALNKDETKLLKELDSDEQPKWERDAIEKGKKFMK